MARKLSDFKKPDTKWQGSWEFSKNMTRICKEAGVWLVAQLDRAEDEDRRFKALRPISRRLVLADSQLKGGGPSISPISPDYVTLPVAGGPVAPPRAKITGPQGFPA